MKFEEFIEAHPELLNESIETQEIAYQQYLEALWDAFDRD